ncbi:IclR family transcriptional regulator [Promicromonospora sukumoe]|uniref:DNA-binding IclR family transcriptional regulator n=1 Tax=Promicromonospora sukumoe TaxID=88382 RepID=A0A7W3PFR5_9MICO|nr:IclR family transcriptional regulator [Promicromonospora sukumoe]MBA8810208.1 DNA-binding IclR family transcriptional regulator [Promicromonospora sukumoe]
MNDSSTGTPGTLARGLDIVERVAAAPGTTVQRLAADLGLSRSAAYRIVGTLRERGYVVGETELRLGPAVVRLGLQALDGLDIHAVGPEHLRELVAETEETAFIAIFDEDQMCYVMQEEGPQVVKVVSKLGSRAPLHASGLGKAYLSGLPEAEAEALVGRIPLPGYTPTTLTTAPDLLADLAGIRDRGWALDDAEREPGVRCVAAPVRGAGDLPVAAISVAGPRDRIVAAQPSIVAAVLRTAARLSAALGAAPPTERT